MAEEKVGEVVKFFANPSVAAIKVTAGQLAVGDRIRIKGHTTDFEETISSMQMDNNPIEKADPGQSIGIKVGERVREGDQILKIEE
jgi:putative protease